MARRCRCWRAAGVVVVVAEERKSAPRLCGWMDGLVDGWVCVVVVVVKCDMTGVCLLGMFSVLVAHCAFAYV